MISGCRTVIYHKVAAQYSETSALQRHFPNCGSVLTGYFNTLRCYLTWHSFLGSLQVLIRPASMYRSSFFKILFITFEMKSGLTNKRNHYLCLKNKINWILLIMTERRWTQTDTQIIGVCTRNTKLYKSLTLILLVMSTKTKMLR